MSDGRVLTEILRDNVLPKFAEREQGKTFENLGAAYKQIMASFGQFSMDTLIASTGALASDSLGDKVYADTETALANLGAERDALASQIRAALWNAEFNNQKLDNQGRPRTGSTRARKPAGPGARPGRVVPSRRRRTPGNSRRSTTSW